MARLTFAALLVLFVALVAAQRPVDDFRTVTSSFQITAPGDSQDRTTAQGANTIIGTEREIYIAGNINAGNGCTQDSSFPQSDVEAGFWSVAQGRVCAADFEMRLDGAQSAATNAATRGFDLGVNLNTLGTGMLVSVSSDLDYSFTIEIASSASAVSTVSQNVAAGAGVSTEFEFLWSDFQGSADFSNVGAISFKFPGQINRDAEVSGWVIITPNGGISGIVFGDCNCDNIQNNGDQGIQSVSVTATGPSGSSTTTTASDGSYSFAGLEAGTYTVSISGQTACTAGSGTSQTVVVNGNNPTANFNVQIGGSQLDCPVNVDTTCGDISIGTTGNAEVVSSCSGGASGTVTFSDSTAAVTCTGPGAQISTITRTFSSSGLASCTQQIRVFDRSVAPTLNIPADFTTNDESVCAAGAPSSTTGTATASGPCTVATVSSTDSTVNDCSADCNFEVTIVRTWTAVDACGNTAESRNQRISCSGNGDCPVCPICPNPVTVPTVSNVPVNPPTRNCRFICDDDDSSANVLSMSVLAVVALFAMLF
jgi:hypothetical protein